VPDVPQTLETSSAHDDPLHIAPSRPLPLKVDCLIVPLDWSCFLPLQPRLAELRERSSHVSSLQATARESCPHESAVQLCPDRGPPETEPPENEPLESEQRAPAAR